jgi:GNAT superfamily N-acetyltransferase
MPTESHLDLTIRQAEVADAHAIADLFTAAREAAVPMMPPSVHPNADVRLWMAARLAEDHEAWLAERDGELLGYALLTPTWLDHLFIRPDQTGNGIGGVLLDVVKSIRPDGFELWVFESNVGARAFYRHRGLVEVERTDGAANEEKAPDVRMAWRPAGRPAGARRGPPVA